MHRFGALKPTPEALAGMPKFSEVHLARGVIPAELDLRASLMPIRDQADTSECVAFATSCMKEYQERKNIGLTEYFSPQYIYDRRSNAPSDGMYPNNALDILKGSGCALESSYPFKNTPGSMTTDLIQQAANFKINSYALVNSVDELKQALASQGVCTISFPVYNYSMMFWRQNSGDKELGGHCVSVVGYSDSNQWFILRNSWGVGWGQEGYCFYPYSDWGKQWDCYSSIDADSNKVFPRPPAPPSPNKKTCCVLM